MDDCVDGASPSLAAGTPAAVSRRKFELTSAELPLLLESKAWFEKAVSKSTNHAPVDLRRNTATLLRKLHEVEPRKHYVDSIFCVIHMTSDDDFLIDRLAGAVGVPVVGTLH
jgi:hypothetical protein